MAVKALKSCCCCCCEQPSHPSNEIRLESVAGSLQSLTDSEHSLSHSLTSYDHSQRKRIRTSSFRGDDRARDVKPSPLLECFVIPSFGEDPPKDVAVKLKVHESDKMASEFLKGVGEDFDIIQQLIKEDDNKQLYEVSFMCHFAQKKVEVFKKAISEAMKDLKLKPQKGCKHVQ